MSGRNEIEIRAPSYGEIVDALVLLLEHDKSKVPSRAICPVCLHAAEVVQRLRIAGIVK